MSDRYKIIEESQSWHCCFNYTIVDLQKPDVIRGVPQVDHKGEPRFLAVCECFTREDAELICQALNALPQ